MTTAVLSAKPGHFCTLDCPADSIVTNGVHTPRIVSPWVRRALANRLPVPTLAPVRRTK
jgi:hypothetical protein